MEICTETDGNIKAQMVVESLRESNIWTFSGNDLEKHSESYSCQENPGNVVQRNQELLPRQQIKLIQYWKRTRKDVYLSD